MEKSQIENPYEQPKESVEINSEFHYPLMRSFLAFLAIALTSLLASFDSGYHSVIDLLLGMIINGLAALIVLNIIAAPIAFLMSMPMGLLFKHVYFKVLRIFYYLPYGIFIIGSLLFILNLIFKNN